MSLYSVRMVKVYVCSRVCTHTKTVQTCVLAPMRCAHARAVYGVVVQSSSPPRTGKLVCICTHHDPVATCGSCNTKAASRAWSQHAAW